MSLLVARITPHQRTEPLIFWEERFLSVLLNSEVISVSKIAGQARLIEFRRADAAIKALKDKNNLSIGPGLYLDLKESRIEFSSVVIPSVSLVVEQGDVLDLKVCCLICPSDPSFAFDGGLGKHIFDNVGERLQIDLRRMGRGQTPQVVGNAVVTESGYLVSKGIDSVVHSVIPRYDSGRDAESCDAMQSAILRALGEVQKLRTREVGVTIMGSGGFGWPEEQAIAVLIRSIEKWIGDLKNQIHVRRIHVFDHNLSKVRRVVHYVKKHHNRIFAERSEPYQVRADLREQIKDTTKIKIINLWTGFW